MQPFVLKIKDTVKNRFLINGCGTREYTPAFKSFIEKNIEHIAKFIEVSSGFLFDREYTCTESCEGPIGGLCTCFGKEPHEALTALAVSVSGSLK